jgi:hypothetical protein
MTGFAMDGAGSIGQTLQVVAFPARGERSIAGLSACGHMHSALQRAKAAVKVQVDERVEFYEAVRSPLSRIKRKRARNT